MVNGAREPEGIGAAHSGAVVAPDRAVPAAGALHEGQGARRAVAERSASEALLELQRRANARDRAEPVVRSSGFHFRQTVARCDDDARDGLSPVADVQHPAIGRPGQVGHTRGRDDLDGLMSLHVADLLQGQAGVAVGAAVRGLAPELEGAAAEPVLGVEEQYAQTAVSQLQRCRQARGPGANDGGARDLSHCISPLGSFRVQSQCCLFDPRASPPTTSDARPLRPLRRRTWAGRSSGSSTWASRSGPRTSPGSPRRTGLRRRR